MSIFEFQEFNRWEGFNDLNIATMKLRGSVGDHEGTRQHFERVPAELKEKSLAYLLELSINSLSGKQLKLATELGALDLITSKTSLEVALAIRDSYFMARDFRESGHIELLARLAPEHGEAFAVDTMQAAFNSDIIERRLGLKSFPSAQEKADGFARNLKLMERFIEPRWLKWTSVGNVAFRQMAAQETSTSGDADFSECMTLLSHLETNDLSALMKVVKQDIKERSVLFSSQIDRALRHDFQSFLHSRNESVIFDALVAKPMSVMTSLLTMSPIDLTGLISGTGLGQYAEGRWITESNVNVLADKNLIDLINLFHSRLEADPYFVSNATKPGGIKNPDSPGIPFLLMAPMLNRSGVYVDLKSKYGGTQKLFAFARNMSILEKIDGMEEYISAGVEILTNHMDLRLQNAYKTFSSDKVFGKDIKKPKSDENPDGVDRDYQIRFAAVRLCAEMHQETAKRTEAWEKKHTPYQYLAGKIHDDINCKEALLALVKTYDEATILDALVSYKPGIMPMIEAGVLGRSHMNKLTLKERGKVLENDLGM